MESKPKSYCFPARLGWGWGFSCVFATILAEACGSGQTLGQESTMHGAGGQGGVDGQGGSNASAGRERLIDGSQGGATLTSDASRDTAQGSVLDASDSLPPSCRGLAATCGPLANEDCCTSSLVGGGTFYRSYDGVVNNDKSYPATVSDFRLDNYEITVGRFRKFVAAYSQTMTAAGAGKNPNNASDPGWDIAWNASLPASAAALTKLVKCDFTNQTWTDNPGSGESRPMNCIDWYEAYAFCMWDGGRLPTEAEWNYAAAGGSEQRQYPWGAAAPDCSYANYYNIGSNCVLPANGGTNNVGSESPKGDGKWGQSDLAGNVWELTEDWFASPYPDPCNDCFTATPAPYKVLRGGSFYVDARYLLSSYRGTTTQSSHDSLFGARCARIP